MKIQDLFEEVTAPITPKMSVSFKNLYNKIKQVINDDTGITITPKWLAGTLNQYNSYKHLDSIFNNQIRAGKSDAANDTHARIIARDALSAAGLVNPDNGYLPVRKSTLSAMRQFYSDEARQETGADDAAKHTREANAQEYDEWFNSLDDTAKNYVKNLQELEADELAAFKGIINAKENKKQFVTRMYQWSQNNDVAHNILQNMGMITPQNKLNVQNIENLREFLDSVTDARLKDILSKSAVYTGKSIVHSAHRASNKVLKDMENKPNGKHNLMLKLYHYISNKVKDHGDKDRAFRRMLQKIPIAHDPSGNPSIIGKGALTLFKEFGGQHLDPTEAIAALNKRYEEPADLPKRAAKSAGRGESIRKVSEI